MVLTSLACAYAQDLPNGRGFASVTVSLCLGSYLTQISITPFCILLQVNLDSFATAYAQC